MSLLKGSTAEEGVDNPRADMVDSDLKLWKNFGNRSRLFVDGSSSVKLGE